MLLANQYLLYTCTAHVLLAKSFPIYIAPYREGGEGAFLFLLAESHMEMH